jgi:hypothetical protein
MAPVPNTNGTGTSGNGSNTSGYGPNQTMGPVPDPNNTRDVTTRVIEIENRIRHDEHVLNEVERFLKRNFSDFQPTTYSNSTGSEIVPSRKKESFGSDQADPEKFEPPIGDRRKAAPRTDPVDRNSVEKPELPAPLIDEKPSGQKKEGSSGFKESEPVTLRLQDRVTTQAVAPRERMLIVTKQAKTAIAKNQKPQTEMSEQPRLPVLARN